MSVFFLKKKHDLEDILEWEKNDGIIN
jgi:hypothetical protein